MKANQSGIAHLLLLVLLVIVVGTVGYVGYRVVSDNQSKITASNSGVRVTSLKVESDPSGITMSGNPLCDSTKLNKFTAYTCTQLNKSLNTVVTAPSQVNINGQVYSFTTWDGCSASNANKAVCKVLVSEGTSHTIKASYNKASTAGQATPSNSSGGATVTSGSNHDQDFNCAATNRSNDGYALCTVKIAQTPTTFWLQSKITIPACTSVNQPNGCLSNNGPVVADGGIFTSTGLLLSCDVTGACTPFAGQSIENILKPTTVTIKAPLKAHMSPFGYGSYGGIPIYNAVFYNWGKFWDVSTNNYTVSAIYNYDSYLCTGGANFGPDSCSVLGITP